MEESISNILEKIEFKNKDLFKKLLLKCVQVSKDSGTSTYAIHDSVLFKFETLFKEFTPFLNEFGKDKKYEAGVHALAVICEELAYEMDKEEYFILFHIRDLGKFRLAEKKLRAELEELWKQYPDYALDSRDFSISLKNLMRKKFIQYRAGNLHINKSVIIRYKTR